MRTISGDHCDSLELSNQIRSKVNAFDFKRVERDSAAPLIVGTGGIGGFPDRQSHHLGIKDDVKAFNHCSQYLIKLINDTFRMKETACILIATKRPESW